MTSSLRSWDERPVLSASILNPALIAASISWASKRYASKADHAMPLEYVFLVVPICLHQATRQALPTTTRTHMPTWINEHQELLVGFPVRATKFAPHVREGLRLALSSGMVALTDDGALLSRTPAKVLPEGEMKDILTAAGVFGAWAAKTGSPTTVYTLFGVTP
ncbi:three component ABC system middle component [Cryobacterium sp. Y50]|uniref:three component ABC system middle component n=1 Tax=Cryobacterium sp. Y50 TaxID=2048286 RepID=UPI000CE4B057|nr:three component ABC system middle component [Cryobacterium sp. Y50]